MFLCALQRSENNARVVIRQRRSRTSFANIGIIELCLDDLLTVNPQEQVSLNVCHHRTGEPTGVALVAKIFGTAIEVHI